LNAQAFQSGLYGLNSKVKLCLHFADISPEEAEDVSFKQVNLQTCELCNIFHLLHMTYGIHTKFRHGLYTSGEEPKLTVSRKILLMTGFSFGLVAMHKLQIRMML
jgi:hypothetical protein